jgi:ectoine hydroxylase-related dioxygenase (phytanoyl-CoA dioxygenase family)
MKVVPMTDEEKYFFDLTGYLVVENALTSQEVAECNAAIDHYSDRIKARSLDRPLSEGSSALQGGSGRLELTGMLAWEKPWCEPFRKLLVHPQIVGRLNEMSGKGFRLDHGPLLIGATEGTEGHRLHGAGEPFSDVVGYHHHNGRMLCAGVTVAWQFADVNPGDGGFALVPGSHKANYPTPRGVRTVDNHMGLVTQPAMKAGSVLFFMECATHGTLPWKGRGQRRSVLYKYAARHVARAGGPNATPEGRWGEWVCDMTDEQRAVMYGPYVHGPMPAIGVEE